MKQILVPCDFSDYSRHAINAAIMLAFHTRASVTVLHICRVKVPTPYLNLQQIIQREEKAKQEGNILLQNFIQSIRQHLEPELQQVPLTPIVQLGLIVDEIIRFTEQSEKIDYIMMGTKGATGLKEVVMGSNTAAVIESTIIPVIAIPQHQAFRPWKKIVLATNLHAVYDEVLAPVVELIKIFDAHLHIIHVDYKHNPHLNEQAKHLTSQLTRLIGSDQNLKFEVINGSSITQAINEFVRQHKPDLLVMTKEEHSNFERIFIPSTTVSIAHHAEVPLLVLHSYA
jgi:nucleotide-binding universal stress UspA family protein